MWLGACPGEGTALGRERSSRATPGPQAASPPTARPPGKLSRRGGGNSSFPEHACKKGRVQAVSTWQSRAPTGPAAWPQWLPGAGKGTLPAPRGQSLPAPLTLSPPHPAELALPRPRPRPAGTGPRSQQGVGARRGLPPAGVRLSRPPGPGPGFSSGSEPHLCVRGRPRALGHSPGQDTNLHSGSHGENKRANPHTASQPADRRGGDGAEGRGRAPQQTRRSGPHERTGWQREARAQERAPGRGHSKYKGPGAGGAPRRPPREWGEQA